MKRECFEKSMLSNELWDISATNDGRNVVHHRRMLLHLSVKPQCMQRAAGMVGFIKRLVTLKQGKTECKRDLKKHDLHATLSCLAGRTPLLQFSDRLSLISIDCRADSESLIRMASMCAASSYLLAVAKLSGR